MRVERASEEDLLRSRHGAPPSRTVGCQERVHKPSAMRCRSQVRSVKRTPWLTTRRWSTKNRSPLPLLQPVGLHPSLRAGRTVAAADMTPTTAGESVAVRAVAVAAVRAEHDMIAHMRMD